MAHENDDPDLDLLFDAARRERPELGPNQIDRLVGSIPAPKPLRPIRRRSFGSAIASWLPAIGGLSAATAVGVWIGVAVPTSTLLNYDFTVGSDPLDLSAFYMGADPTLFLFDEAGS